MNLFTLVRATDADIPEIVALMNLAYRGGDPNGWSSESYISGARTSEALLREEIAARPDGFQLVWRRDDGYLQGSVWLAPKSDGIWYLGSLTIDPAAQNGGLGRALLDAADE